MDVVRPFGAFVQPKGCECVWEVITRAEHLGTWFSDAGADIDLRPGGALALHWKEYGTARGRIETVEPPRTFAFRWVFVGDGPPTERNSTLVVFTLTPDGDQTRLRVAESGFASLDLPAEQQAKHVAENTEGWRQELAELLEYLADRAQ
jgi:uncharacterized protein YndB with AHSA1/START domain